MKNLILIIFAICLAEFTQAQSVQNFEFNNDNWILPEGSQSVEFQGKQSLLIERTSDDSLKGYYATVKKFNINDGIIEFDMFCAQQDSTYAGFLFRLSNYNEEDRYELFYFDPLKSNDTGAVQYMPVNNHVINWPDYDCDVYKSDGDIPWNEWIHIKAEIEGCSTTVFVNDVIVMTVPNLARGRSVGKVGLWLGNSKQCYFSDFKMTVDSIISGITGDGRKVYASSVECDQTLAGYVFDGDKQTRWSSEWADPQWIMIDLGNIQKVGGVILRWESAYAKAYEIRVSKDSVDWATVYSTTNNNRQTNEIPFEQVDARYVMMYGTERITLYGYSIYEFEIYEELESPSTVMNSDIKNYFPIIYPNPVSDQLYIDFQEKTCEANIQLINLSGRIIYNQFYSNMNKVHITDLSDIYNGIYIIKIQTKNNVFVERIVLHKNVN